jgi:hypothetical protein
VRQVVEKISAIDVINVDIIVVRPSVRPRLRDFKVVPAVSEVRPAADHGYVADSKMMVMTEMRAEMRIVDALHMLIVPDFRFVMFVVLHFLIMSFFLPLFFFMVIILRYKRDCPRK